MSDYIVRTMIVAAEDVALARSLAEGLAGDPARGMWLTELSPTGTLPATHYVSSGPIYAEFSALLGDAQGTFDAAGGAIPLDAIQGMYDRATFGGPDEEGLAVIKAAGLQIVSPEAT